MVLALTKLFTAPVAARTATCYAAFNPESTHIEVR
jgi:hypothetical protein